MSGLPGDDGTYGCTIQAQREAGYLPTPASPLDQPSYYYTHAADKRSTCIPRPIHSGPETATFFGLPFE